MGAHEDAPRLFHSLNMTDTAADYMMGKGGTWRSSVSGWMIVYFYWYVMLHVGYYTWGIIFSIGAWLGAPWLQSQRTSRRTVLRHILTAERSFPLLSSVGFIAEQLRVNEIACTCASVEACGGWARSIVLSVIWFLFAELLAYLNHVYVLHGMEWLKPYVSHDIHHRSKKASDMTFWSGYAFSGVDGTVQSLPLVAAQVLFPAPAAFVKAYTVAVAMWTMYIHGGPDLGWPFLGPDYHLIHHTHDWYNFGFFTCFWDTVFGTVKHPHPKWAEARTAAKVKQLLGYLKQTPPDLAARPLAAISITFETKIKVPTLDRRQKTL